MKTTIYVHIYNLIFIEAYSFVNISNDIVHDIYFTIYVYTVKNWE